MSAASTSGPASRTSLPGLKVGPLWTLFTLSMRQFLRGKRALVMILLALLPAGLALMVRSLAESDHRGPPLSEIEFVFLFNMIPYALLPLTALLYGSGLILDEQEEQTLTYLLIRPLPKWALYLTKFLAAACMLLLLGIVFVLITYLAIYLGSPEWHVIFSMKLAATYLVMVLAMVTYLAVFGALSLFVQRSLIVGIIYIALIEGILASIPFALRQLTVMFYFRVLSLNWLDLDERMKRDWKIDLTDAPGPTACVLILLAVAALATLLAMRVFSTREFYVKTPETN